MKITLEVSEDNESTDSPWWVIVDPRQNLRCNVDIAAGQIEGPFFSREEAQAELRATHYNYSKRACVYCMSGYHTKQYKAAWRKYQEQVVFRQVSWFKILSYKLWKWMRRRSMIVGTLMLLIAPAYSHGGPDGGVHHFLAELLELWPFAMAVAGVAWARLRR